MTICDNCHGTVSAANAAKYTEAKLTWALCTTCENSGECE